MTPENMIVLFGCLFCLVGYALTRRIEKLEEDVRQLKSKESK